MIRTLLLGAVALDEMHMYDDDTAAVTTATTATGHQNHNSNRTDSGVYDEDVTVVEYKPNNSQIITTSEVNQEGIHQEGIHQEESNANNIGIELVYNEKTIETNQFVDEENESPVFAVDDGNNKSGIIDGEIRKNEDGERVGGETHIVHDDDDDVKNKFGEENDSGMSSPSGSSGELGGIDEDEIEEENEEPGVDLEDYQDRFNRVEVYYKHF